jgi:hypothetical protein
MYPGGLFLVMAVSPGFLGMMLFIADMNNFNRGALWRVGHPGTLAESARTSRDAEVVVGAHAEH